MIACFTLSNTYISGGWLCPGLVVPRNPQLLLETHAPRNASPKNITSFKS